MTKVEIGFAGSTLVEDVTVAMPRSTAPATATPPNIGLIEISAPTVPIPGPPGVPGEPGPPGPPGDTGPPGTTDWNGITNKPATFPPTVPIAQSDVTGLAADLDNRVLVTGDTMTGDLTISKGLPLLSIIGAAADDWASVWFQPDVAAPMSGWDIGADNNGFWIDRYSPGVTSPIHIDTTDSMALINQMWITSATPNIILNGTDPAQAMRVRMFRNFKTRWEFGALGDAETGGDAGSTFAITSSHDDGSYKDIPFQISRSGNRIQVAGDPTAPLHVATKQYVDAKPAGGVITADTPPASPVAGQLWFESDTGNTYIWYVDANSSQWVQINFTPSGVRTADARNRIVNPAMQISQENGSAAGTVSGYYVADQWRVQASGIVFSARKSTDTAHQISMTVTTGKTPAAGDYLSMNQPIEGIRIWDFGYGATGALPSVLRFEAYTNAPGTYGVCIRNGGTPPDRSYAVPFTVSTVNTWTPITLAIPGDTAGTWPVDNSSALSVNFTFASGTTFTAPSAGSWVAGNFLAPPGISNGAATTNNILYLRNVGLHLDPQGSGVAPPWQMPDEAQELLACMRYWQQAIITFSGNVTTGIAYYGAVNLPVMPRTLSAAAVSGVATGGVGGFAATAGTFAVFGNTNNVRETRNANATRDGLFQTNIVANARM